jgi:hypothetical protein
MPAESGTRAYDSAKERLRRHAFALVRELNLSDEERQELAMMLPGRKGSQGPVSWALLDVDELAHLVNWLEGARLVLALYRQRP